MTDRKQFEAMLEALINDDQETAKDIFHNIVVSKSREIYEELLSEDFSLEEEEEKEEDKDKEEKDSDDDSEDDSEVEEAADDSDADDEPKDGDVGGDATDDFIDDVEDADGEGEPAGDGAEGEEDLEDRVMDLEDALEELKAEFEQLMASDEGEGEPAGDDMADMGADMGDMDAMGGEEEPVKDEFTQFMEYVDKVALPKHGDNGANAKSVVAGKNDMGGTTANIAKGGESKSEGTKGGLLNPSTKEENAGNVNVPGAKSATKLSSVSAGHGAEKKGKAEQADNKKSIVGSR